MDYYEYTFSGINNLDQMEILMAMLSEHGYLGFQEKDSELLAYIDENLQDEAALKTLLESLKNLLPETSFISKLLPDINWNEKWEQDFNPIRMENVHIRASFHLKDESAAYDLLIDPKMSFGTGHHETTRLMIKAILDTDFREQTVLDMGCGTGVLGILALKRSAAKVVAVDIDAWAVENSRENAKKNHVKELEVRKGNVSSVEGERYNIILANINRNILLQDIPAYSCLMNEEGLLIISGFLEKDKSVILAAAEQSGFTEEKTYSEQNWLSIVLRK